MMANFLLSSCSNCRFECRLQSHGACRICWRTTTEIDCSRQSASIRSISIEDSWEVGIDAQKYPGWHGLWLWIKRLWISGEVKYFFILFHTAGNSSTRCKQPFDYSNAPSRSLKLHIHYVCVYLWHENASLRYYHRCQSDEIDYPAKARDSFLAPATSCKHEICKSWADETASIHSFIVEFTHSITLEMTMEIECDAVHLVAKPFLSNFPPDIFFL